jgi:hypothetical protein
MGHQARHRTLDPALAENANGHRLLVRFAPRESTLEDIHGEVISVQAAKPGTVVSLSPPSFHLTDGGFHTRVRVTEGALERSIL